MLFDARKNREPALSDFSLSFHNSPERVAERDAQHYGDQAMTTTEDRVVRGWWASAYRNERMIWIATRSGYRGGTDADYRFPDIELPVDADDKTLGEAVLMALSLSRFVLRERRAGIAYPPDVEFDPDYGDLAPEMPRYQAWVADQIQRHGYKTRRALFKKMMNCHIQRKYGRIAISPSNHCKLEAWTAIPEEYNVYLPETAGAEEIGAGLRRAFAECI